MELRRVFEEHGSHLLPLHLHRLGGEPPRLIQADPSLWVPVEEAGVGEQPFHPPFDPEVPLHVINAPRSIGVPTPDNPHSSLLRVLGSVAHHHIWPDSLRQRKREGAGQPLTRLGGKRPAPLLVYPSLWQRRRKGHSGHRQLGFGYDTHASMACKTWVTRVRVQR